MRAKQTPKLGTWLWGSLFLLPLTVLIVTATRRGGHTPDSPSVATNQPKSWTSLAKLTTAPRNALTNLDIGLMNLLCTYGLPGSKGAAVEEQMKQLDKWAARISAETARHQYRYQQNPKEFNHAEGFFRMLMMSVVLAEDFHVQYDPSRQASLESSTAHDGFFSSPNSIFLSGLLGEGRKGTCSSLPVLYVALGRRLGYPLYLVTTKGHLFVRWDGQGERFNIEAAGHGLNTFDDDYYRKWPLGITADEEQAEGHLRNLDPAGELALFLSIRGMCLKDNGRIGDAAQAFAQAAELAPQCRSYSQMSHHLKVASLERR